MMDELKHCPFCGSSEISFDYRSVGRNRYREDVFITFLKCDICGAQSRTFSFDGNDIEDRNVAEGKSMAAWNRRCSDG